MHIIHFYKGMGLRHEAAEMRRCYALAHEMRRHGLGVCVYLGGTMHTETMYRDHPEARDWACVAADGGPVTYMMYQLWRHFACINHPGYRAFVNDRAQRRAVEEPRQVGRLYIPRVNRHGRPPRRDVPPVPTTPRNRSG
jgi:hypothetical protein